MIYHIKKTYCKSFSLISNFLFIFYLYIEIFNNKTYLLTPWSRFNYLILFTIVIKIVI